MSRLRRDNNVGNYLTELRRSNASGLHDHKQTRSQLKREAIVMSLLDMDYPNAANVDWDREPTDAELEEIDETYPNTYDFDEEDWDRFYHLNTGYEEAIYPDDFEYDELDLYDIEYDAP